MVDAGLYIHIPFCEKRCNYCDFFSCVKKDLIEPYVEELTKEISLCGQRFPAHIDTIYLGGGTPSILTLDQIDRIFSAVYKSFSVDSQETTMEVNPNSSKNIAEYKKFGVDRVSLGVQTLDPILLKKIGRLHTPEEALDALSRARNAYDNVSADLIIGLDENQDVADNVNMLAPYCTHISGYMLSVPKKSPIKKMIEEKKFFPAKDDVTADQYDILTATCRELGFYRYETSNYAKLGKEGVHNGNYWTMKPYLGVGPSAHSYFDGARHYNVDNLKKYLEGEHSGNCREKIERKYSKSAEITETIMLAFRTAKGLDVDAFNKKYEMDFKRSYANGIKAVQKYLGEKNGRIYILPQYFSVQNGIILSILTE